MLCATLARLLYCRPNFPIAVSQSLNPQATGYSVRYRSNFLPKHRFAMRTAYFKQLPGEEQCQISFHLLLDQYKIDKVFNFNRSLTEQIDSSLDRIRANVEKEFQKKNKRKKVKKSVDNAASAGTEQAADVVPVVVSLGTTEQKLTNMTIADVLAKFDAGEFPNAQLTVLDTNFQISYNSPEVHAVKLPTSMLADFYVYPSRLELHFATRESSTYCWSRGQMPASGDVQKIQWEQVSTDLTYMVQKSDVGYHLKFSCTPKDAVGRTGPTMEIIASQPVQAGPGLCPFEVRHLFTQQKLKDGQFRVVSYNLLAELYSDSDYSRTVLFSYTPQYALEMDYRKQLFIKEILGYKGDIVCLQEVDSKIFSLDLVPIFHHKNLTGHYKAKRNVAEGLATFYDVNKFELVEKDGVIISEIVQRYPEVWNIIRDKKPLVERVENRSSALQLTLLRSKHDARKHLLVANTHLYFSPDADHVRLLQIGFSMLYVREQYERIRQQYNLQESDLALLFCGDFNSVPECGIYKLMTERFVGPDFIDWQSNKEEAVENVSLSQPFKMASACGCPEFTNYTIGFTECIDYIFYQTDVLNVNDVIPMPSKEELSMYEAIPSPVFPSDHVALVANMEWAK
ncbi:2',5'-phosphodiesterase 12 [Anopheles maculipalpis]|uniref:2',5'-phosphodiesterase 12 n=1 Tax=Anopheles maculipalpis TaxID=1496333 RepID=UPI002158EAD2|nr:2',5'-phosphodiesterase 12 [Anopheles maculipalpis]